MAIRAVINSEGICKYSWDGIDPSGSVTKPQGDNMTGKVYDAVVIKTETVPAGEGVSTGKEVSNIVYSSHGFVAPNDEIARAIVLAEAIARGVKADNQLAPVEVKLRAWA